MTDKHRDPVFLANARIIRAQVRRARRLGTEVYCWRCGRAIQPEDQFDVGHIDPDGGPGLDNLAAEHRRKSAVCIGNRAAGGKLGAAITNARRAPSTPPPRRSSGLLNWRRAGSFFGRWCNPRLRLQQQSPSLNGRIA